MHDVGRELGQFGREGPGGGELAGEVLQRLGVTATQEQVVGGGELAGDGKADAARGAGDQGNRQFSHGAHPTGGCPRPRWRVRFFAPPRP